MGTQAFSQVLIPKTGTLTLTSGAAQKLTDALGVDSKLVRFVAVSQKTGTPKIGDAAGQGFPSLVLNCGDGKWVDLNTIWVSGAAADQAFFMYSDTFP